MGQIFDCPNAVVAQLESLQLLGIVQPFDFLNFIMHEEQPTQFGLREKTLKQRILNNKHARNQAEGGSPRNIGRKIYTGYVK